MELSKDEHRRIKREAKAAKALARAGKQLDSLDPAISITILCVRFGNKYGREYVERLRNMVRRHLTVPYELACLTDDQHPIDGVRTIYQPNAQYAKGWWHKVHMFDPNLPLKGRIIYMDLDVVICNSLNKLVSFNSNGFNGILDFNRKFHASWNCLNSSVMSWTHGEEKYLYEKFVAKPGDAQRLHGDQDWIWKLSKDRIKWWPKEWIQSYKWEIRNRSELAIIHGKRTFREVNNQVFVDPACCIAVFHGDPNPCDVQDKFVVENWR